MKISRKRVPLLLFSCLLVFAANIWAYPLDWALGSINLGDGGGAGSSVILDEHTGFSAVQIKTSATSRSEGASYGTTFGVIGPYYLDFAPVGGSPAFSIGWNPNVPGSGAGVVDVGLSEGGCTNFVLNQGAGYCGSFSPSRAGLPGARFIGMALQEVNVPEPDIVILMGLGLAGIAFTRMNRKQRQRKASLPE